MIEPTDTFTPGSPAARERGCICDHQEPPYIYTVGCPLHVPIEEPKKPRQKLAIVPFDLSPQNCARLALYELKKLQDQIHPGAPISNDDYQKRTQKVMERVMRRVLKLARATTPPSA